MASKTYKNLLYNISYQLINVLIPLLTVPYISRILGVESNGIYSYTYSIVNYFMIFAMLGISNYGNRHIAKTRDDATKRASSFCSIYLIQIILNVISISAYIFYCLCFAQYTQISWLEILFLLSTLLDISWLYFGLEEFKVTVTRNVVVKIISIILMFLFVHSPDDVYIYALIMGSSTLISQLVLWGGIKHYINFSLATIHTRELKKHLKGILVLFIPVISYSIYKIMDKIMLGAMYSTDEVAFYEYAEKVINIPIGIVTAVGTVMLPKISNLASRKNSSDKIKSYFYDALRIICFLSIPCCLGLIVVGQNLSTIFLGEAYLRTGIIMQFLSITFLFTAWANVVRTQWLIPNEKDSIYITTTIAGAVANFVINMILIPKYGGIGAAIGTICAEFLIMFSQSFMAHKEIKFKPVLKDILSLSIKGAVMACVCIIVGLAIPEKTLAIFAQIATGICIYLVLNLRFIKKYYSRIKSKTT